MDNAELHDLSALSGVTGVGGDGLIITGNGSLIWLEGLEGLRGVHGDLVIGDNPVMTTVSALSSLSTVDGTVAIFDNPCVPQSEVDALVAGLDPDEDHGTDYSSGNLGPCGSG